MTGHAERVARAVGALRASLDGMRADGMGLGEFLGLLDRTALVNGVGREDLRRAFAEAHGDEFRVGLASAGVGA